MVFGIEGLAPLGKLAEALMDGEHDLHFEIDVSLRKREPKPPTPTGSHGSQPEKDANAAG